MHIEIDKFTKTKKLTKEIFIERSIEYHGIKYDYTKSFYINANAKVEIICKEHGSFFQTPKKHYNGHGCQKCSKTCKLTNETFKEKAINIHGNRYDYSKVNYINTKTKVEIICEYHGSFYQTPDSHLNKNGCNKCSGNYTVSLNEFIKNANKIHDYLYDYSKVIYVNTTTKIEIICKEHGMFIQTPNSHLSGRGCSKCANMIKSGFNKNHFMNCAIKYNNKAYFYIIKFEN